MNIIKQARAFLLLGLMCLMSVAGVNAEESTPEQVVENATQALVAAAKAYAEDDNKQAFDDSVMAALDPVVAFEYIARGVMGKLYFKVATSEQREAFAETFKGVLVGTYAKGIATYANSTIVVLPSGSPLGDSRKETVVQEVSHDGATHQLSYSMGKNKEGKWKLLNVTLNGVNLGRSFGSQFSQLADKHAGDIDKVIENWNS